MAGIDNAHQLLVLACFASGASLLFIALLADGSFDRGLLAFSVAFGVVVLSTLNGRASREGRSMGIGVHVLNLSGAALLWLFASASRSRLAWLTTVIIMSLAIVGACRDLVIGKHDAR